MNREIKFRMWNDGKMINAPHYLSSDLSPYITLNGRFYIDGIYQKDMILMQFIGLLDKNGKEIYEGDILKNEYNEINIVKWTWGKWHEMVGHGEMGAIINSGFRILSHGNKHEIIGNIYENPELLEK